MDYLMHYGILGMKWGVRRYQMNDGSLTSAGRDRYRKKAAKLYYKERVEKQRADRASTTSSARNHQYKQDNLRSKRNYYESMLSSKDIKKGRYWIADKRRLTYQSIAVTGAGMVGLGSAFIASAAAAPLGATLIGGGTAAVIKSVPNARYYSREKKANKP